jgi:HEPN domain-containing protein
MRPETEPWWRQAQADLVTSRQTLALGRYYAASWFAQQAAEKGLKALYIERRGSLAPRTHDLEYLGVQANAPAAVAADLQLLNPAFDLVRYPDPIGGRAPVDAVTPALANDHLGAAERVLAWIDAQLNRSSNQPS